MSGQGDANQCTTGVVADFEYAVVAFNDHF
jgi:hypothetical protein